MRGGKAKRLTFDSASNLVTGWSPDGSRILFTRKVDDVNFDVFTIRPDGTDLLVGISKLARVVDASR